MRKPNKVEFAARSVIEHKLLTALDERDDVVAILASKQDLEDIIASLFGYQLGEIIGDKLTWEKFSARRKDLGNSLQQLLEEAFPTTTP